MADTKTKELWPVTKVKFREAVVNPSTTSEPRVEFSEARELKIEFDPAMRVIVLTHMRPGAKEGERVPNTDRRPVTVPLENVVWMR